MTRPEFLALLEAHRPALIAIIVGSGMYVFHRESQLASSAS